MAGLGDYELTAVELAEALGGIVGDATIRNWVASGLIPSAYVWRSPTRRMYFKRKTVAFLLAGGSTLVEPPKQEPKPKAVKRVRPVRWDGAA
jgi:hypothetical protein